MMTSLYFYQNVVLLEGVFLAKKSIKSTKLNDQVVIAQRLAPWLATGEVPGSNPGKGENLLISD